MDEATMKHRTVEVDGQPLLTVHYYDHIELSQFEYKVLESELLSILDALRPESLKEREATDV